jgi:glycosyltransferase involved in cell wall biosynthesis
MPRTYHFLEPFADGHRMEYVRRFVEAVSPLDAVILSTGRASFDSPTLRSIVAVRGKGIRVQELAKPAGSFLRAVCSRLGHQLRFWSEFRAYFRSQPDTSEHVFVPYLDYCAYGIGLLGSPFGGRPFSGLVMRPNFHWRAFGVQAPRPTFGWLRRRAFLRLLKHPSLQQLLVIDPTLFAWIQEQQPPGYGKVLYYEDPADLAELPAPMRARAHFGIGPEARVILVYGSLDTRKNIRGLLDFLASRTCPPEVRVLLVGKQSPEVRGLLRAPGVPVDRIIAADRYVDKAEEALAFAAADWVWLAYKDFYGPSGVLAQAAQAGRRVLHNGLGIIGYRCRRAAQSRAFCGTSLIESAGLDQVVDLERMSQRQRFVEGMLVPVPGRPSTPGPGAGS